MRRARVCLVVLGCLTGCASSAPAPPAHLGRAVAVLPPNNRTGDPLLVTGASVLDRYVRHAERVTVADVLLSEARFQLQENGFEVADRHRVETALNGRVPESPTRRSSSPRTVASRISCCISRSDAGRLTHPCTRRSSSSASPRA